MSVSSYSLWRHWRLSCSEWLRSISHTRARIGCNVSLSFNSTINLHFRLARSVYSTEERVLLAWLSYHYESQRKVVWSENTPQTRWVISFDNDLLDGLVLATLLSAYCPFLVSIIMLPWQLFCISYQNSQSRGGGVDYNSAQNSVTPTAKQQFL